MQAAELTKSRYIASDCEEDLFEVVMRWSDAGKLSCSTTT